MYAIDWFQRILAVGQSLQVFGRICSAGQRQFFYEFSMRSFLVVDQYWAGSNMIFEGLVAARLCWSSISLQKAYRVLFVCSNAYTNLSAWQSTQQIPILITLSISHQYRIIGFVQPHFPRQYDRVLSTLQGKKQLFQPIFWCWQGISVIPWIYV